MQPILNLILYLKYKAVDRTTMSSLKEAKDALMNVAVDYLQAYSQLVVSSQRQNTLLSPVSLRLIPTYCLALLKNVCLFKNLFINLSLFYSKYYCLIQLF